MITIEKRKIATPSNLINVGAGAVIAIFIITVSKNPKASKYVQWAGLGLVLTGFAWSMYQTYEAGRVAEEKPSASGVSRDSRGAQTSF